MTCCAELDKLMDRELARLGAMSGDDVRIGKIEFTYEP